MIERNKQVEAAEESERAWIKQLHDNASYMTVEERAKVERLKLYHTLKARNALDVYYQIYPDERSKSEPAKHEREGRERER